MKIDIHHTPPQIPFKNRTLYICIFVLFLALFSCGIGIAIYTTLSDTPYYELLENVALVLFIVPPLIIAYFGGKLQAYKKLTPPQRQELEEWCANYEEIRKYCQLVAKTGRKPVRAEYEASLDWVEKLQE